MPKRDCPLKSSSFSARVRSAAAKSPQGDGVVRMDGVFAALAICSSTTPFMRVSPGMPATDLIHCTAVACHWVDSVGVVGDAVPVSYDFAGQVGEEDCGGVILVVLMGRGAAGRGIVTVSQSRPVSDVPTGAPSLSEPLRYAFGPVR